MPELSILIHQNNSLPRATSPHGSKTISDNNLNNSTMPRNRIRPSLPLQGDGTPRKTANGALRQAIFVATNKIGSENGWGAVTEAAPLSLPCRD